MKIRPRINFIPKCRNGRKCHRSLTLIYRVLLVLYILASKTKPGTPVMCICFHLHMHPGPASTCALTHHNMYRSELSAHVCAYKSNFKHAGDYLEALGSTIPQSLMYRQSTQICSSSLYTYTVGALIMRLFNSTSQSDYNFN